MRPEYATVVDVIQGKGVKIKKDGEKEALDIYYNNLGAVNVGDKVYIKYTSGSILVVGKVHSGNTDTGGGSSTGVTKEYVDTQDAELSRQINVLSSDLTNLQKLKAPNARGTSTKPSDYINTFKVTGLKTGAECGLDGKESFVHVFGINAWADTTAGVVEFLVGETGKLYKRYRKNNTEWEQPIELATTTKTDISFPFDVGYETQTNYQSRIIKYSNNTGLIIVSVKKTDGTEFVAGSNINICNALPVGFKAKYNEGTSCRGEQPNTIASVLIYNQRVIVTPLANCKVIIFTLSYEIGG